MSGLLVRGILAASLLAFALPARAQTPDDCHIGAYRFADGGVVDVAPSQGATMRWRMFDGTTGQLTRGATSASDSDEHSAGCIEGRTES